LRRGDIALVAEDRILDPHVAPASLTTLRKVVASNGVRTAYDSDGGMAKPLLSAEASRCGFSKIKLEQSEGAMGELSGAADIP
jgi:hypothetical protein